MIYSEFDIMLYNVTEVNKWYVQLDLEQCGLLHFQKLIIDLQYNNYCFKLNTKNVNNKKQVEQACVQTT